MYMLWLCYAQKESAFSVHSPPFFVLSIGKGLLCVMVDAVFVIVVTSTYWLLIHLLLRYDSISNMNMQFKRAIISFIWLLTPKTWKKCYHFFSSIVYWKLKLWMVLPILTVVFLIVTLWETNKKRKYKIHAAHTRKYANAHLEFSF